ncbi:MAG: type II toxin-antitoxin system VapC family toxin [Bacteroidota bacterium]
MNQYLLDTDICIHLLKGKYNLKKKVEEVGIENCFISEITIAELTYGAFNSTNFNKHIQEVTLIENLFNVLPIYDSLPKFGEEKARLRKLGRLLPDFDLLIGTTAVYHHMMMVTKNEKHLSRIDGVRVENLAK